MSELSRELIHLGRAERDIAEGEARITRQQVIVDGLKEHGEPAGKAEELLGSLKSTLATWREHRLQILNRIAQLEARR
jgi:hypothetical protein